MAYRNSRYTWYRLSINADREETRTLLSNCEINSNLKCRWFNIFNSNSCNADMEEMKTLMYHPDIDVNEPFPIFENSMLDQPTITNIMVPTRNFHVSSLLCPVPLHFATMDIEKLELLLTHPDIDPNYQNKDGKTLLHFQGDNIPVCELLLAHPKIDLNIKDKNGSTPIHGYFFHKLITLLVTTRNDIDINCRNNNGTTLLLKCDPYTTELLLKRPEIDVNIQNNHGDTALHCAKVEKTRLLLNYHDTNPNIKNNDGDTALHVHYRGVAEFLNSNPHYYKNGTLVGEQDYCRTCDDSNEFCDFFQERRLDFEDNCRKIKLLLDHPNIDPFITNNKGDIAIFELYNHDNEDKLNEYNEEDDEDKLNEYNEEDDEDKLNEYNEEEDEGDDEDEFDDRPYDYFVSKFIIPPIYDCLCLEAELPPVITSMIIQYLCLPDFEIKI